MLRILFTFPDWFENCLLIFRSLFVHIPELFIDILIFVRHVLDLFSASTVYPCNASCISRPMIEIDRVKEILPEGRVESIYKFEI